jgi:hypothetical protein
MLQHFAPNDSLISYSILIQFFKYRIQIYKEEQKAIQKDMLYYFLKDQEAIKLVETNERLIEEYEWLVEFLENNYQTLTF